MLEPEITHLPGWMRLNPFANAVLVDREKIEESTIEPVRQGKEGILLVKGPIVIDRYFVSEDPELRSDPNQGFVMYGGAKWFNTKDLVAEHPDQAGLFQFRGRVSRNVKMGSEGEFVSLDAIEKTIGENFPRSEGDPIGELFSVTTVRLSSAETIRIVLFTTKKNISLEHVNQSLRENGIAFGRITDIFYLSEIPLAGSGKVALSKLKGWAQVLLEEGKRPGELLKVLVKSR
jgi:non-ribosomal peptide synthetase component E (peptide arylation enzyme)